MTDIITSPTDTTADVRPVVRESRLGGKGAKLARLGEIGVDVPAWFGIEADAFRTALDHRDVHGARERAVEAAARDDFDAASDALRTAVLALPLPQDIVERILDSYRELGGGLVAVRSSAIGEDGAQMSFAGQFDSVLGVRGERELLDAVRTCWASAFNPRAIAYRVKHGLDALDALMGVVVQRQIRSDVSGVLFTGDPINGDPQTSVVSACWGLGEALVSGLANADTYRVDRRNGEITVEVADKDVQIVLADEGLTRECEVEAERRTVRCLSDSQVRELVRLGKLLQEAEGCPQDVEWAYEDGQLHVLQTRPITSKLRPAGIRRVWDNSNIVESYSGVVSPLTFSFARDAYAGVYIQAMGLLRIPEAEKPRAAVVTRQMLGTLDGRVYYNLASWYYLLSVLPNYEEHKAAMEQMMGVRQTIDHKVVPPASKGRTLSMALGLGWHLLTVRRKIDGFREHLFAMLKAYDRDWLACDADELVEAYDELKLDLLNNWQVPIINDFRVMVFFDKVRQRLEGWQLDENGTLQNDLMCGQGEVESAEPTYMLIRMAERVRAEPALRRIVLETDDARLRELVKEAAAHGSEGAAYVDGELDVYLRRFGDRCANELKLETPTLRENPAFLFSVLRNFVRQDDLTERGLLQREREICEAAEAKVRAKLAEGRMRRTRTRVFFWVLKQARSAVRDREALRFDRTRVFGLVRSIMAALGHRFAEQGLIDDPRDVFFLEVDEVIGTVQGTCTTRNLRGLVELRRAEHDQWLAAGEMPDRVETVGTTNANPFDDAYAAVDVSGDALSGIGCCPGVVERRARVVHAPDQGVRLDGDIMVCTRTDPGWVPLFPSCGGLLVERGSLLSHSAIVAREFGIPAIVGIPGLMGWARDGEQLHMDGTSGVVRRADVSEESDDNAD
jgi:pyruvate,water dikinase